MKAITRYEVYQAAGSQWAMTGRFGAAERDGALGSAQHIEDRGLPAAVIEENEDLATAQFDVRLIHRSMTASLDLRAPANSTDLGSRFFMVALNALTAGAVVLVLAAVAISRIDLSAMGRNITLLGVFVAATTIAGLLFLRVYIPLGVILWRAKDPESRRHTALALMQGRVARSILEEPPTEEEPLLSPEAELAIPPDDFATTVALAPAPARVSLPTPIPTPTPSLPPPAAAIHIEPAPVVRTAAPSPAVAVLSAQAQAAILDGLKPALAAFTEEMLVAVNQAHTSLTVSERLAINLYVMGAASAAAQSNSLDPGTARVLAKGMLEHARLSPQDIAIFFAELNIAGERPRYRRMMDEGRTAFATMQDTLPGMPPSGIADILLRWNDAAQQRSEPQQVTFVLTDLIGFAATTDDLGTASAQRVQRAHNAIVRAAAKAFRGREVERTGDGMLFIFPDSTTGARAAIDILQEAAIYGLDNPATPLAIRIGLHTGEATYEDGEYFGPAIVIVGSLCALVSAGEICCSATVRQKVPSSFRFEELGARTIAGASGPVDILKLAWDPKRPTRKATALEYGQIGATSPPTATSACEPQ